MATTPEKKLSASELVDLAPLATEPGNDLISTVQERDEQKAAQDQSVEKPDEDQSKIEKALEDAMSDIVERGESEDISGKPIAESDNLEALEEIPQEANIVDEDHVEQETTHDEAHDEAHDEVIVEASEDAAEGEDRCARVEV
ncbi:reticulocyte-binding protein 2 isoform X2 [Anopheles gambiae]|uniref:reticulocyte-binding protein 2 isoform X1 n=1 Tax=Anopheles gambiae TaxID=7165 RepID=UPI002AC97B24|nr:reticulocyte-binding protein 2 isoform X1 [Anopheles gambiae]XP_061505811.1 reticulocyte-binding protein 2 isoform X2 [Anopheles gambiae]